MEEQTIQQTRQWVGAPAIPIVLGYLPVGFAFGILASKAGITPLNTLAMSVLVYAGSAQLIAVGLVAAGASPLSIILTTFIVNLRHFLMAAALSPYLAGWRHRELAAFAFEITDESFAVHSTRFAAGQTDKASAFWINAIAQLAWVGGTLLGISAGGLLQDVRPFGLDFALPAMFVALLMMQIKNRRLVVVALLSGTLSMLLLAAGVSQWNVILATILAASIGLGIPTWTKPSSS